MHYNLTDWLVSAGPGYVDKCAKITLVSILEKLKIVEYKPEIFSGAYYLTISNKYEKAIT